jgi:hypothetical protein
VTICSSPSPRPPPPPLPPPHGPTGNRKHHSERHVSVFAVYKEAVTSYLNLILVFRITSDSSPIQYNRTKKINCLLRVYYD